MTIRRYDFNDVGVETGTQPSTGTPSASTDLVTKGYADGAYVETTGNETVAGVKTFSSEIELAELVSTPSIPPAGFKKFYPKADGKNYTLNSAGSEVEVGAGAGGSAESITTKTNTDYTVTDLDGFTTILVSTGSTNRTMTLPTATDNLNRVIRFKKSDSGTGRVIVDGEGSETIDGSLTFTLYLQNDFVTVQCNGTSWYIVNKYLSPIRVVAFMGGSTATGSISNNSTTIVDLENKSLDSHSAVTTGSSWVFTAPRACTMQLSAGMEFGLNGQTFNGSEALTLYAYKNGSNDGAIGQECPYPNGSSNSSSFTPSVYGGRLINLASGDTVNLRCLQTSGGTILPSQNSNCFFTLAEIQI